MSGRRQVEGNGDAAVPPADGRRRRRPAAKLEARSPDAPIRVVIVDDEPVVRSAVGGLVRSTPGLDLVGSAADASSGLELIERERPDVAIVDVRMGGGGESLTTEIRRRRLPTRTVVLSAYADRDTVVDMLSAGAAAYVVKGAPIEEIVDAVRSAWNGHGRLEARIVPDVVDELGERVRRERRLAARRARIRERIAVAIEVGPRIVYQRIVELETGRTAGHEALSRFDLAPQRGPDRWFREAASVGRLVDLELRTLGRILQAPRPAGSYVSINVHPTTLSTPEWAAWVGSQDWREIVVEITEHDMIRDWPSVGSALADLRARGARISVDDAGAGFSSLRQILLIKPDYIKLDGELTAGIDEDPARRALATAVSRFASEIGAIVVAERIETEEERAMIAEIGIEFGQGYLLGRPGPLEAAIGGVRGPAGAR